jgi:hypothetical protein
MKAFFQQLLTGKDNQTYDIARVTWLVGFVAIIAIAGFEAIRLSVSLRELAEALGIVSGAGGVSVMAKKDTEPQ